MKGVEIGVAAPAADERGRARAAAARAPLILSRERRLQAGSVLSPLSFSFRRRLDPEGNPSAGILFVHLASVPGMLCPTVEIGPDGNFELHDLAPGSLSVWIHGAGGDARTTLAGQAGDALVWDAYPRARGRRGARDRRLGLAPRPYQNEPRS